VRGHGEALGDREADVERVVHRLAEQLAPVWRLEADKAAPRLALGAQLGHLQCKRWARRWRFRSRGWDSRR
jgi:hypothetical protein